MEELKEIFFKFFGLKTCSKITYRNVLELLCVLLNHKSPYVFKGTDYTVDKLTEKVLISCLNTPKFLGWEGNPDVFIQDVRAVFMEVGNV